MSPTRLALLFVLLVQLLAAAAEPEQVFYSAGVFIPAENRTFTPADRAKIEEKFPGLQIIVGDRPKASPAEFVAVRQPAKDWIGADADTLRYRSRDTGMEDGGHRPSTYSRSRSGRCRVYSMCCISSRLIGSV